MVLLVTAFPFCTFFAVFVAATGDEILQTGQKVGTSSNQVLLGALVVALIIVVVYMGKKQEKNIASQTAKYESMLLSMETKYTQSCDRMDEERTKFGEERVRRIDSLMRLMAENTVALNRTATAEVAMSNAVDAMKMAIHSNNEVTKELLQLVRKTNGR